jgi:hypothetical protein
VHDTQFRDAGVRVNLVLEHRIAAAVRHNYAYLDDVIGFD